MERVGGCSCVENILVDLPAVLTTEEQVRKELLSESPLQASVDVSTQSLTEFPRYDILQEKFRNALNELESMLERAGDTFKKSEDEQEYEDSEDADWDDPFACQLENLLAHNLYAHLRRAVQKIVKCGYTEEAAQLAVLNSNLLYGSDNLVSNVVDGALALLKWGVELNKLNHPLFEELQNLIDYTLLEMVHVVREVRPELTIAESMWSLVISDMNLVKACALAGGSSDASYVQDLPRDSTLQQAKSENSCTKVSYSDELDVLRQTTQISDVESSIAVLDHQLPSSKVCTGKESSIALQEAKGKLMGHGLDSSHGSVTDVKLGSKKGLATNSRRDILRQKVFPFEKNFKARTLKGSVKAKVAALGGLVLEKPKLKSGPSSTIVKEALLTAATGKSSSFVHGSTKDSVFELPAENNKFPASSVPIAESFPNGETNVRNHSKSFNYYALIPFDEADQRYVPQDDKDESIMVLVLHKQRLEKELVGWTDWANKKVMEVAGLLRKNRGELQIMRQEKEEIEKFKKEKQSLEESMLKRLSEMDYALTNASGQIEGAGYTVRQLEEDNSALQKDMETAKLNARVSARNVQEAMQREQEVIKKVQLCEVNKGFALEQMNNLKCQIAQLDNLLKKAKEHQNRIQFLLRQEEKEKAKVAGLVDALRAKKRKRGSFSSSSSRKHETNSRNKYAEIRARHQESGEHDLRIETRV